MHLPVVEKSNRGKVAGWVNFVAWGFVLTVVSVNEIGAIPALGAEGPNATAKKPCIWQIRMGSLLNSAKGRWRRS